ncbi:MAG: rhodanese-like domain-containing protein [Pseudomonadota bacterium]
MNNRIVLYIPLLLASILHASGWCGAVYAQDESRGQNFHFGTVSTGPEVSHTFDIPNMTEDFLRLKNATSSCDSVHVLAYSEVIHPHGTGHIELRVNTFKPQAVDCEIVVEFDDPKDKRTYRVRGTIEGQAIANHRELSELPGQLFTRKLKRRDSILYITPESLMRKLKKKEDLALVDVRSAQEFNRCTILDSINIPLFGIKTKQLLKPKTLVLFDEGHGYRDLEREAEEMKQAGFTLFILDGGLYLWKKKGGEISGGVFAHEKLKWVSPNTFFIEKDYEHWLVVDVDQTQDSPGRFLIPHALHLSLSDRQRFISEIKAQIKKEGGRDQYLSVLIIANNEKDYRETDKLVQEAGIDRVFYLQGGMNGYASFLLQQAAIWKAQSTANRKVITTSKGCPTCPH